MQAYLRREHALFIIGPHDENPDGSWDVVLFLLFAHKGHKMLEEVEIKFAIFVEKSRDVQLW